MKYICTNPRQKGFYNLVGPFLGNRQVAKDLGMPIWNDSNREWVIALVDGKPIACSSIEFLQRPDKACLKSAWVKEDFRGRGIYTELLRRRIEIAQSRGIRLLTATATELSLDILLKHGFRQTGRKGKYYLMQLEIRYR